MTEPGKAQQPQAHPLLPTAEYHCGNCQNTDCDWYPERETLSRINTHGDNHFSMRLATEMSGCRFHTSASQQRIDAIIDLIYEYEGSLSDGYGYYGGKESVTELANKITLLQAGRK